MCRVQWVQSRWSAELISMFPFSFLFIPFFLVNNPVSVSGIPSMQFRGILPGSEPHQWVSLTMQRYNIFGRNAIVVPAFESACPGSCEKSGPGSWSFLRPDVGNITSRRRNCYVATQEKGRGGERDQRKRWKSESEKVKFTEVSRNRRERCQFQRFRVRCKREKKYDTLRYTYIIMYARKYYSFFLHYISSFIPW